MTRVGNCQFDRCPTRHEINYSKQRSKTFKTNGLSYYGKVAVDIPERDIQQLDAKLIAKSIHKNKRKYEINFLTEGMYSQRNHRERKNRRRENKSQ